MTIGKFSSAAVLMSFVALVAPSSAIAQSAVQECIQQGFKPGTAGFYHCLQGNTGGEGGDSQDAGSGEAASILSGDPDNAVTDYSGSTMDGATAPDPNILKQLNPGGAPGQ